jgi:serine/threonine-protein kinase RsbW
MSVWWSLHLRREAASVPLARRLLLGAMETAGVDPEISFDLSVALSEACANAVEHGGYDEPGGAPAPAAKGFRVTAYLDGERCRIEVTDSGPGFLVRRERRAAALQLRRRPSASAENGRGLCLIQELADHVDFRNRPGRGAMVRFDKVLRWREHALLGTG